MNVRPAADALKFEDLTPGMTHQVDFQITRPEMEAFAALSGDYNPMHLDDEFAATKSFKGAVVYGGLLVAKISQLIGMKLPGRDALWASITLDFLGPLYVGVPAQAKGTISSLSAGTRMIELDLVIQSQGQSGCQSGWKKVAKGKAEVILVGA